MQSTFPLVHWQETMLAWWKANGRILPWREKDEAPALITANVGYQIMGVEKQHILREKAFHAYMSTHLRRDPYRVVVAELMLQQTQVDRVLPKYIAWMKQWPKIQDLAKAELSEILIFWQGLGYNRRARFLWLLAKEIVEKRKGEWPKTEEELLQLPGLGKYTARAVLSFAFGDQVAVVDTNVKRVLRRITEGNEAAQLPVPSEKEWFAFADSVVPLLQADPWNQLIMDFGALICTAKAPKCETCPVQQFCEAQQKAVAAGFQTYRDYLREHPLEKKKLVKTVKFEQTDRYFRGRIMDVLRTGEKSFDELWKVLHHDYGLLEEKRFQKLIENLAKEGLIQYQNTLLKLG